MWAVLPTFSFSVHPLLCVTEKKTKSLCIFDFPFSYFSQAAQEAQGSRTRGPPHTHGGPGVDLVTDRRPMLLLMMSCSFG